MQKAGLRRITLLVLMFCLWVSKAILAQPADDTLGFSWKLLEVTDPTTMGKIKFTDSIPITSTNVNWDFGDGNTALGNNPVHIYDITTVDSFVVKLNFKLNSIDSTVTHRVCANSAFFTERLDPNTKVTYVRILRSAFGIQNNIPLLGNMRFEWTINDAVLIDTGDLKVSFSGTFGQFPNIRYPFENGGVNTVTLKAWNIADANKYITFTRPINILPDFSLGKVIFDKIPNVFTPNGDGILDFFEVSTSGKSRLVFKVFTRTGTLAYQNQATFIKWDGKNSNGKDLSEGMYYYIIEDLDGLYENAKGFFYIFRGK